MAIGDSSFPHLSSLRSLVLALSVGSGESLHTAQILMISVSVMISVPEEMSGVAGALLQVFLQVSPTIYSSLNDARSVVLQYSQSKLAFSQSSQEVSPISVISKHHGGSLEDGTLSMRLLWLCYSVIRNGKWLWERGRMEMRSWRRITKGMRMGIG
jgi:hypothetical protein